MGELTTDLVALYEAKYPRFYNALKGLDEEKLIELMIELCDVFPPNFDWTFINSVMTTEIRGYKVYCISFGWQIELNT